MLMLVLRSCTYVVYIFIFCIIFGCQEKKYDRMTIEMMERYHNDYKLHDRIYYDALKTIHINKYCIEFVDNSEQSNCKEVLVQDYIINEDDKYCSECIDDDNITELWLNVKQYHPDNFNKMMSDDEDNNE